MFRSLFATVQCSGGPILPLDLANHDKISKDSRTARGYENRAASTETGKDRLWMMFSTDDTGTISTELNSIYQAAFMGFMGGAVYGGFIKSRLAYLDFMENNQATAFKSHFEAKKKLQDQVTINFAKGAFRWGWRLSLFTASYVGIVTTISVYRGKSSIYEYLTAGTVTGSLYKVNMGLRGMAVGGLLGGGLGGVAGVLSLLLMKVSGTSMEEVRYWQYQWKSNREQNIRAASKVTDQDDLMASHDQMLSKPQISLEQIPAQSTPVVQIPDVAKQ